MEEFTFKWPGQGFAIGDLQVAAPIVQGGMGIGVSGPTVGNSSGQLRRHRRDFCCGAGISRSAL